MCFLFMLLVSVSFFITTKLCINLHGHNIYQLTASYIYLVDYLVYAVS